MMMLNLFPTDPSCSSEYLSLKISTKQTASILSVLDPNTGYTISLGDSSAGFTGFISRLRIYSIDYCLNAYSYHSSPSFPTGPSDPYQSNLGATCACLDYSCTGSSSTCIECSSTCSLACTSQSSSDCIPIISICQPYAIISGICDPLVPYIANCKVQLSTTQCSQCDNSYILSSDQGACCQSGYYGSYSWGCTSCQSYCSVCTGGNPGDCTSCVTGAINIYGYCVCFLGTDPLTGNCIQCKPECATCSVLAYCDSCVDPNAYLDSGNQCICIYGYFMNTNGGCDACHADCFQCSGSLSSNCLSCNDVMKEVVSGVCTCYDYYYWSVADVSCISCHSNCIKCTDATEYSCTKCSDINAIVVSSPGSCVCKTGFYPDAVPYLSCLTCHQDCITCTGGAQNQCSSCNPDRDLSSGTCICKQGFYDNGAGLCLACGSRCRSCTGSPTCVDCIDSSMILNSGVCQCPDATFWDNLSNSCISCPILCQSCQDSLTCLTCTDSNSVISNGICNCKSGFYLSSLKCIACDPTCKSCSGPANTNCLSCINPNYLPTNGVCSCEQGYFLSELDSNCYICHETCLECDGPTYLNCTQCKNSHQRLMTKSGSCLNCISGCLNCENDSSCTECFSDYYLNETSKVCEKCDESCLICQGSDQSACLACLDEEIILDSYPGKCGCGESEYISNKSPLKCEKCQEFCLNCDKLTCLTCIKGYELISGSCIKKVFYLSIDVLGNYSVVLKFSKVLEAKLTEQSFNVTDENDKKVGFSLENLNDLKYLIEIKKNFTSSQKFWLKFMEIIYSQDGSLIDKLSFSFTVEVKVTDDTEYTGTVGTVFLSSFFLTGIFSIIMNRNNPYIWVCLNNIQMLAYTPLINIDLPLFLNSFLKNLRPLSLLSFDWLKSRFYSCDTKSIPDKFYEYGFSCKNFFNNMIEISLSFTICLFCFFIIYLLNFIKYQKLHQFTSFKLKDFKYSFFIRFWIQSFIDLLIPVAVSTGTVTSKQFSTSSSSSALNSMFGLIFSVIFT